MTGEQLSMANALSEQIRPVKWEVRSKWHDEIGWSDAFVWTISVEDGGSAFGYAVRSMSRCLSRDGEWELEPIPSSRNDDWLDEHRFKSLDEALTRALVAVETLTINGLTPQQAAEKWQRRLAEDGE